MIEQPRRLEDGQKGRGSVNVVQRVKDSVLRPIGRWSPAAHELLQYLEAAGFPYSPRLFGVDHQAGQERLTYIQGEVAMRPWPECLRADNGIIEIANLLRAYHEAVADFKPSIKATWRVPDVHWEEGMIVRHGDLGPWNMVWDDGHLVGLIDWDFTEPGFPIDDVAQVAWYCVPLWPKEKCLEAGIPIRDQQHRLTCLCETYGIAARNVIPALIKLQSRELKRIKRLGRAGIEPWVSFATRGDIEEITTEMEWLQTNYQAA